MCSHYILLVIFFTIKFFAAWYGSIVRLFYAKKSKVKIFRENIWQRNEKLLILRSNNIF